MAEYLRQHYDAISEYHKLKRNLILTSDEVLALKEREFCFKNEKSLKRCKSCGKKSL